MSLAAGDASAAAPICHAAVVQPKHALEKMDHILGHMHWAFTATIDLVVGLVLAQVDGKCILQLLDRSGHSNRAARGMHRQALGTRKLGYLCQARSAGAAASLAPSSWHERNLSLPGRLRSQ